MVVAISAGLYVYSDYKKYVDSPFNESSKIIEITIDEGSTTDDIAEILYEKGLIKSTLYFDLYIKQSDLGTSLQAGTFRFPKNSSMKEIAEYLQNASLPDVWVTIPEGLMVTQIADLINEAFLLNETQDFSKDEFLALTETPDMAISLGIPVPEGKPLEGFIYPDTYRFPADATAEYVLNSILVDGFQSKIYDKYEAEIENSQFSLYEIVTLASILERETRSSADRPLVADILIRRYENGWAFEVDATLLYYFKDWTHEITYQDLQLDTPYNTRKYVGFTPTPISNPGEETIKAILYPEANDYWFYLNDSDGILHYATTLSEHENNIEQYIQ